MKYLSESFKILVIAILLIFTAGVVGAWTGPTATPPNNNVAAPINVSAVTQEKAGIFGSHGFFSLGSGWFSTSTRASWPVPKLTLAVNGSVGAKEYCDDNGQNCVTTLGGGGGPESGMCKAGDIFDSGWVDTTTASSKDVTITHNLGTTDTVVYYEVKGDSDFTIANGEYPALKAGQAHNYLTGDYHNWYNKTANQISFHRYGTYANRYVRFIIWKKGCGAAGSSGSSSSVDAPDYKSAWTSMAPDTPVTFTHNLGTTDYRVEIERRVPPSSPSSCFAFGENNYGTQDTYFRNKEANTIKVVNSTGAYDCNKEVRVLLWKY